MNATPRHKLWRTLIVCIYGAALLYFGLINVGPLPTVPVVATDKLIHALCFGGLEVLIEWAAATLPRRRRALTAVVLTVSLGGILELVQAGLPYRSAEVADLVADAVGACLAALGVWAFEQWVVPSVSRADG